MRDMRTMLTLVHHGETLTWLKLFAQPMDRAEVLHTPRYDISGSWKKYSWRKRSSSFIRKFNVSTEILYIVCGLLATQHARCHKEYYSPRGQAVSTSHVLGGDSRQRNQFAILSTISSQERRVFSKFHDFHVPRLHHGKP